MAHVASDTNHILFSFSNSYFHLPFELNNPPSDRLSLHEMGCKTVRYNILR